MLIYWLWFALLTGLSVRDKLTLLERFSDPEDIYTLTGNEPELTENIAKAISNKDLSQAQTIEKICARKDINILPFGDSRYPNRLRHIFNPPIVLYYKGILPDFNRQPVIGVVGTRKASVYGLHVARQFGEQIAACGGIVVSGGASGGDTMAHQGAMAAGGLTVAVLGSGVDVVYPPTNRRLFMEIAQKGCLISEYIPGDTPERWHFPERNRIISGLSDGVLVTEAPKRSGALITAKNAMEQGKDVYVVPGNIDMPTCQGSNALLQEGAGAVVCGWDIMKVYQALYPGVVKERNSRRNAPIPKAAQNIQLPKTDKKGIDKRPADAYSGIENKNVSLTEEENRVLACLNGAPKPVDDVIAQAGLPAGNVLRILTKLTLMGMTVNHPGKLVSVRKQ